MTGAHLHGVGALPGPAPALKAYDPMFARHGVLEPRIPTHGIRNPPTRRARSSVPRPTCWPGACNFWRQVSREQL